MTNFRTFDVFVFCRLILAEQDAGERGDWFRFVVEEFAAELNEDAFLRTILGRSIARAVAHLREAGLISTIADDGLCRVNHQIARDFDWTGWQKRLGVAP